MYYYEDIEMKMMASPINVIEQHSSIKSQQTNCIFKTFH